MTVLPEIILHRAIINGFRHVRKDSRLFDVIFRNLHQVQLKELKDFILGTKIDFSFNYPRQSLKVPHLILLLKNESEAQTFLGNILGDGTSPFVPDQEHIIDTLGGHAASTSESAGLPPKVKGPLNVVSQTGLATVNFAEDALNDLILEFQRRSSIGCLQLYVVAGAGRGYEYDVARIRNNSLDITTSFNVNLDNTSVVDLRMADDPTLAEGEPSRVYESSSNLLKKGVNYEVTYQLSVIAAKQTQVIYLYNFIKAILLSQKDYLESQGIQAFSISGSDFAPRSEYLPDEIFTRVMNLSFVYGFSFLEEQETFNTININLLPEPTDNDSLTITLQGDPITINVS